MKTETMLLLQKKKNQFFCKAYNLWKIITTRNPVNVMGETLAYVFTSLFAALRNVAVALGFSAS